MGARHPLRLSQWSSTTSLGELSLPPEGPLGHEPGTTAPALKISHLPAPSGPGVPHQ